MSNNRAVCDGIGIKLLCQDEGLVQLLPHALLIIRAEVSRSLQPCLVDDVILVLEVLCAGAEIIYQMNIYELQHI